MSEDKDPELTRLLLEELSRQLGVLKRATTREERRRAVHSLKGSAGLSGQLPLHDQLSRIERRILQDDMAAVDDAITTIEAATAGLQRGAGTGAPKWPHPPADLVAAPVADPAGYVAAMQDRLERIDVALAAPDKLLDAAMDVYREVHAMKGAALAVGDDVTAWFCHGLEEQLAPVRKAYDAGSDDDALAKRALFTMAKHRGLLAEVVVSPRSALETMRGRSQPPSEGVTAEIELPLPPKRPSVALDLDEGRDGTKPSMVRVSALTLDRLFERIRQVSQAKSSLTAAATDAARFASQLRKMRLSLTEALRQIGPPRLWGAPAAAIKRIERTAVGLDSTARRMDADVSSMKTAIARIRVETSAAQTELVHMQTTHVAGLFETVAAAISAEARRKGRSVEVETSGGNAPIDRRLADALVDPLLQLARNAVAHGLEDPAVRAAQGKSRVGKVSLSATLRGASLELRLSDDGAGVDIRALRVRAEASGLISAAVSQTLDDESLLALLFVPGLSTQASADWLAGRGVGLDLTQAALRRVGGSIRLSSRTGEGLVATLRVPIDHALVKALWIKGNGTWYALPVQHTRRVSVATPDRPVVPLSWCLAASTRPPGPEDWTRALPAYAVELDEIEGMPQSSYQVGVDGVGVIEELAVRSLSPLLSAAGPYAGAILRGDEIRMCLEAQNLAEIVQSISGEGGIRTPGSVSRSHA